MRIIYLLSLLLFFFACQSEEKPSSSTSQAAAPAKEASKSPKQQQSSISTEGRIKGSKFKYALTQMKEMSYRLKNYKEIDPEQTNFNKMINNANRTAKKIIPTVDMSNVKLVRRAFIKGTESMGDDLYPRANLEAWECTDEQSAIALVKEIDQIKKNYAWDVISKSPITYWRHGNEIVFVTPGGFYMLKEVPKMKEFLMKEM